MISLFDLPEEILTKIVQELDYYTLCDVFLVKELRERLHHLITVLIDDKVLLLDHLEISLFDYQFIDYPTNGSFSIKSRPYEFYFINHSEDFKAKFHQIVENDGWMKSLMIHESSPQIINDYGFLEICYDESDLCDLILSSQFNLLNHASILNVDHTTAVIIKDASIDPNRIRFLNNHKVELNNCVSIDQNCKIFIKDTTELVIHGGDIISSIDFANTSLHKLHLNFPEKPCDLTKLNFNNILEFYGEWINSIRHCYFEKTKLLVLSDIGLVSNIYASEAVKLSLRSKKRDKITLDSLEFPCVKEFEIQSAKNTTVELYNLHFPRLVGLSICGDLDLKIDLSFKQSVAKSIEVLTVKGCTNLSPDLLRSDWKNLRRLEYNATSVPSQELANLLSMNAPNLKSFHAKYSQHQALTHLLEFAGSENYQIDDLYLTAPFLLCKDVTFENLRTLRVKVSDAIILEECKFPALERLELSGAHGRHMISKLHKLYVPNLEILNISSIEFRSLNIESPKLKYLSLTFVECNSLLLKNFNTLEKLKIEGSHFDSVEADPMKFCTSFENTDSNVTNFLQWDQARGLYPIENT